MFIYLMQAKVLGGFVVVSHPQAPKVMLFCTDTREGHDIRYIRGGVDI